MTKLQAENIVIKNNLFSIVKEINSNIWRASKNIPFDMQLNDLYIKQLEQFGISFKEALNACSRIRNRRKRVNNKIKVLLNNYTCYFITMTFNEDYINMPNRRRKIREYLNSICSKYVCNIDYGSKNGRIHYHAVINAPVPPHSYIYGSINFKKINTANNKSLSEYLLKLTSHAVKNTANISENVIYSR